MPNCTRCGATMDGLDAGGNMICDNCEASMHGGSGTDVPCQRCGMYLPSHELQMWNSRLYCAYCIMDIKDEEKRNKGEGQAQEGAPANPSGGMLGGLFGTRDAPPQPEKSGGEPLQQYAGTKSGTCERCGRESDVLYSAHGLNVCPACYFSGGATGSSPSFMGQIVSRIKSAVGLGDRPKIIQSQPKLVFDIGTRKMVEQIAKPRAIESAKPDAAEKPAPSDGEGVAPLTRQQSVFNVRDRKLVGKKEGMAAEQPISEGAQEEKKPSPKAKKLFFKMHPSGGGGAKKK